MVDVKSGPIAPFLREESLRQEIELLFYAYRDFISDPDRILADFGFGRAHHRVVHFVGRNPDITVTDLLAILRITKQSLSRVLGQLIEQGYIEQRKGEEDRRQRLHRLTQEGIDLEQRLSNPQQSRVAKAYRAAGAEAVEAHRKVLMNLIDADERDGVVASIMRR